MLNYGVCEKSSSTCSKKTSRFSMDTKTRKPKMDEDGNPIYLKNGKGWVGPLGDNKNPARGKEGASNYV